MRANFTIGEIRVFELSLDRKFAAIRLFAANKPIAVDPLKRLRV